MQQGVSDMQCRQTTNALHARLNKQPHLCTWPTETAQTHVAAWLQYELLCIAKQPGLHCAHTHAAARACVLPANFMTGALASGAASATSAATRPPSTPGMPCRLCTPHVSRSPMAPSRRGIRYAYPHVLSSPAATPTASAPPGPIIRLAAEPMATPPASVAFWMCTCAVKGGCCDMADCGLAGAHQHRWCSASQQTKLQGPVASTSADTASWLR